VNLESFSLPPIPPPGSFDVRFNGDYRLVESDNPLIQIQSSSYPMKIIISNLKSSSQYVLSEIVNDLEKNSHMITDGAEIIISDQNVSMLKITRKQDVPASYSLEQNYPNPFNPLTTIRFALPNASYVTLNIYNSLGQKIAELVNSNLGAGWYNYNWDASKMASGIYFYELRTDRFVTIKKMILLK
jgi:hypothetical protein